MSLLAHQRRHRARTPAGPTPFPALPPGTSAVIVDFDSVLTDLADVRAAAWKCLLDPFLRDHGTGPQARPFDPAGEARWCEAGDAGDRAEAVAAFLTTRGIRRCGTRPITAITDELLARHHRMVDAYLERYGAGIRPGALEFLRALRRHRIASAAVSATCDARQLPGGHPVTSLTDLAVLADDRARLGLPPWPDPALLLHTARTLRAAPQDTVVVQGCPRGVEAARRGGFGRVIAQTPAGSLTHLTEMFRSGADLVVHAPAELLAATPRTHAA